MKLSVVIPAYNEEDNITKAVMEVCISFQDPEIIVVNDASTDSTLSILKTLQKGLPKLVIFSNAENKGHGYSVIRGLKEATGDYILYIDADRQIDPQNLSKVAGYDDAYDIISGQRVHRNDKLFRKVISFCLRATILFRFRYYIKDSNCPFKIYKRESLAPLFAKVPKSYIIPIACLDVLARKEGLLTGIIMTPHKPYDGVRKGFLQSFNPKMYKFLWSAFNEIIRL